MGPPSMNGGRLNQHTEKENGTDASMGPPSMNGGRASAEQNAAYLRRSFNGAAVDERRKGFERGWWALSYAPRFNGAAVDERRKGRVL